MKLLFHTTWKSLLLKLEEENTVITFTSQSIHFFTGKTRENAGAKLELSEKRKLGQTSLTW